MNCCFPQAAIYAMIAKMICASSDAWRIAFMAFLRSALSVLYQRRRSSLVRDMSGDGIDHNDRPVHLPRIVYCCTSAAAPHTVVDG